MFAQFMPNAGQYEEGILYTKSIPSGNAIVSEHGINYLFYDDSHLRTLFEQSHHLEEGSKPLNKVSTKKKLKYHNILQEFVGSEIRAGNVSTYNPTSTVYNYFLGNDPGKWAGNLKGYYKLMIKDLYDGIDLEIISVGHELKYNFVCREGSDPSSIKIKYSGADELRLVDNELEIKTSLLNYKETMPSSYTFSSDGKQKDLKLKMKLENNVLSFIELPASKVPTGNTLVIDPKLVFSTYSGSSADNFGFTATYDEDGNLYAGGITTDAYAQIPNGKYPTTIGAFDQTYNGGEDVSPDYAFPCDITISKYSSDGKNLIYATYIGGASNEYPHSLVVDKFNNLVILGSSFSYNYPVSINAFSNLKGNGADIVLSKLNSSGSGLIGSTFYGGSANDGLNESAATKYFYADNFRGDIICDDDGSVLGVASTFSDDIVLKNAFKFSKTGNTQNGIIFKFSPNLNTLRWSSFVGGSGDAALYSIDFDANKNLFVSGGISGTGLQTGSKSIHQGFIGGRADGFIAKIKDDGSSMLNATYIGTDKYDQVISLEIDNAGQIYIVGQTEGVMPVKGNVYNNGNSGQFVSILDPDLSVIKLSTTFGTGDGLPDLTINAFMVDECRRTFISGWGGRSSGKYFSSTKNLPITTNAIQKTTDGSDFYILVLANQFKKLTYATYFGGTRTNDHVDGGTSRWDKKGVIYQSVCSSCPSGFNQPGLISDFPTTPGAYAEFNLSPRCSNAAFKFAVENLNLPPILEDTLFVITAFDTLDFEYMISDPDEDTMNVDFIKVSTFSKPFMLFPQSIQGVAAIKTRVAWNPECDDVSSDTFRIRVHAHDRGCPDFQTNSAEIKILVLPPPVIDPPSTICLVFKQNDNLLISWNAIPQSRYFKHIEFYKRYPDGTLELLKIIKDISGGDYLDSKVSSPRTNNYEYFFKVINICDEEGPLSEVVSSVQEITSPIPSTTLVTATVINNKDVSVHWLKSTEPDFGSYAVYRSKNTNPLNYDYLTSISDLNDTFYVDKTVDVDKESFCYSIVVSDNCGKMSLKSNIGCNIILRGVSKPFYHVLDWDVYREWSAGISEYVLERSVDTGILRPVVSVLGSVNDYSDHNLDYDWGGYWYSVVAHESFKGLSAQSRSNSIYLIQPPLLHVPNAFTKNDDGLNETWGFVPVFVKTYHMQVFNRWGQLVFDSQNKKQDWDGNFLEVTKGIEVFVWQVTYTGWDKSRHYQKGTVTVIK
ncbi:MAG: gliding motility-associated C-terminal domain-containing protein [Flavobacteriales bacterium]|nr:gliding motility-associated C-terminal domain-containing protein [Flavobacteriales bacterium]